MWRLLFGKTIRQTVTEFTGGGINLKDAFIEEALAFIDRLEANGVEIAIQGVLATALMTWFRRSVGRKQLLKVGFFRITV